MRPYYFPLSRAALTFPLISALLSAPYVVRCYRKYGSVSLWRTLIFFSFVFYLQCAYYVVVLPLPDPATVASRTGPFYDLTPFRFVQTFLIKSPFVLRDPSTWIPSLKSFSFLEPFFNFLLLAPLGIYLAYYFKKDWKKTFLISFLFSLFLELSQLTGLFWLYPKPYRLFSVDDLMLNSLGGLFGYIIYANFLRFLPNWERVDQKSRERGKLVSFSRRLAAFFVDAFFISALQVLIMAVFELGAVYAFGAALCAYTVIVSLAAGGRTAGKALVRIKVARAGSGPPFFIAIVFRYLLRNAAIFGMFYLNEMVAVSDESQTIWLAPLIAFFIFTVADFGYSLGKNKRLWYERWSWTQNVSTIKQKI
jgi:glycopeptide antibiotics resistance protein